MNPMPDNLDQQSDAELNTIFGKEICGGLPFVNENNQWLDVWPFCTDADAVLPHLEEMRTSHGYNVGAGMGQTSTAIMWQVRLIDTSSNQMTVGIAPVFARAACIALIRAKRATPHLT